MQINAYALLAPHAAVVFARSQWRCQQAMQLQFLAEVGYYEREGKLPPDAMLLCGIGEDDNGKPVYILTE